MSDQPKLYIAGMGAITPVGANTEMTAAMVNAGLSAYAESDYYGQEDLPITMASVPDGVFQDLEAQIDEGDRFDERHDRVIKMAIIAIREACAQQSTQQPVPLVLAMPEVQTGPGQTQDDGLVPLIQTLEHNCKPWIGADRCRQIYSGRAAGMEAIAFVFNYLANLSHDFFLVGGADSYQDYSRLTPLTEAQRLKVPGSPDAFVPGEAAGFLLLTRKPERALARNGHIIALNPPGIAEEVGHLHSDAPYRGEGLDQAFKQALIHHPQPQSIHSIYSSMNGEHHWAKEYGVAFIRNQASFQDPVRIEHPADCYGDLGAATAPVLIALAADHLFNTPVAKAHLVYSSSDRAKRGAIVVEKIAFEKAATPAYPQQRVSNA